LGLSFVGARTYQGLTSAATLDIRATNVLADATLVVSMFYCIKRYLLELAAAIRPEFGADRHRLDQALSESE
jgi:hypothetical protein